MSWGRIDDDAWENEKLIGLTDPAFRLLWVSISFVAGEWSKGGDGKLSHSRLSALARMHGNASAIDAAIAELCRARCLDKRSASEYRIHNVERYMPSADLSLKRSEAGRRGAASTNSKAGKSPAIAAASAAANGPAAGSPVSRTPVNTKPPVSSLRSDTSGSVARPDLETGKDPFAWLLDPPVNGHLDLVGVFVDASRSAGASIVTEHAKARVGAEIKRLRDQGFADALLERGVRELARRNASPAFLEVILGDLERTQAGTSIARVVPPGGGERRYDLQWGPNGESLDEHGNPLVTS